MDKAEAINRIKCAIVSKRIDEDRRYRIIGQILDEYTQQISREKDEKILTLVKQKRALEDALVKKTKAIIPDQSRGS